MLCVRAIEGADIRISSRLPVSVIASVLCVLMCSSTASAVAKDLKIATFNINWGNVNLPDIKRVIAAADADIVCIQECNAVSERFLIRQFGRTYRHIQFRGHRGRFGAERFGFLSRYQLSDLQFVPPQRGLFGTFLATVAYDGTEVRIANVHLMPFIVPRGAGFAGAIRAISAVEATHQHEVNVVLTHLDVLKPAVVCGAFNSLPTMVAPKSLTKVGLIDSFASVTDDAETHPTWSHPVGRVRIQFRIDHIFHSKHFRTIDSRIIPTRGSDHYLVVSELRVSNKQ